MVYVATGSIDCFIGVWNFKHPSSIGIHRPLSVRIRSENSPGIRPSLLPRPTSLDDPPINFSVANRRSDEVVAADPKALEVEVKEVGGTGGLLLSEVGRLRSEVQYVGLLRFLQNCE